MVWTHLVGYSHFSLYDFYLVVSLKKSASITSAGPFSLLSKVLSRLIEFYLVLPGSITLILSIFRLLNTIK